MPEALREWLIMLRARFRAALPPIVITENGASYGDGPDAEGIVDDQRRIDFHDAHLEAVATGDPARRRRPRLLRLVAAGQLRVGQGLRHRFGLVHVDFETQVRTPEALLRVVRRGHRRPGQARRVSGQAQARAAASRSTTA